MTDNTEFPTIDEILATTQAMMAEQRFAEAAEFAYNLHKNIVEDYRANKDSDKPSMKKAAEAFEPSEEVEEVAANVMQQVRGLVFANITENPELAVLLYNSMKEYAQDHIKEYRDAVLRGVLGELADEDEQDDYVLPLSREDLDKVRTMVESFANFAELSGQAPDLPRSEKSGNIKFTNTKGYGESGTTSDNVEVTKFTYLLDGEELPARTLADVALWHVSSADAVYTPSDIMRIVREDLGNKPRSEGWKIEVNERVLEARPITN